MTSPARIAVNGKFLLAGPTGVHRVAWELMRATDAILAAERDRHPAFRLLAPRGAPRYPPLGHIPLQAVGRLGGQLWEQIDLPIAARGGLILNLCNLAPIGPRNAVTMIHDAQVFSTPDSYSRAFGARYRFIFEQVGRRHRRILTVSDYSKAQLVAYGVAPPERIEVIHNGVDHILSAIPDPGVLARIGVTQGRYVVALATTQRHKNIGMLLSAFARPELAGLRLVLVGAAGPEQFAAAGWTVSDNVVFAGMIADGALRALMERAACLAFPSRTEGFGLPPLEAMLLGCPAVIAPCGALPEVCGDAAIRADPDDPAAWAAAILSLADDPALHARQAEMGRAHAARFTWAAAAARLLALVEPFAGG